jgi:hypothetical protein
MSSETHHLQPSTTKKFFGKLQVLNDTDIALSATAEQIDTAEGPKFILTIKHCQQAPTLPEASDSTPEANPA